jgi:ATP-dependent Lon protease
MSKSDASSHVLEPHTLGPHPLLPVTNTVLFPEAVSDLQIWLPQSVRTLQRLADDQDRIVVAFQRAAQSYPMTLEDVYEVGVTARVVQRLRKPDGSLQVILQGLQRVRLIQLTHGEDGLQVFAEAMPQSTGSELEINALMGEVLALFGTLTSLDSRFPRELVHTLKMNMTGPDRFTYMAVSLLNLPLLERQRILAAPETSRQLTLLLEGLDREIQRLRLQDEIQQKVQEQVDKTQRDFLLREQLKVINQELGDRDSLEHELEDLRARLDALRLPAIAAREALKELDHLARLPASSSEWHVLRNYLNWFLELPWHKQTRDSLKLERARQILDEHHTGQEPVKERILEHLAVLALRKNFRGPILCLVGPPGVGKTSFGQSIARAMGRKFIRLSVGGVHDEAEIRGHRRTYVGAMPGRFLQAMRRAGVTNPLILIDEIDKMGRDSRSDPTAALLEVLDPGQNATFVDNYLNVPYDLSKVMFLTTANVLTDIPEALRDRLEIIRLASYTLEEKQRIARRHLLPRAEEEHGLPAGTIQLTDGALATLIHGYTREAGLRDAERVLATVCRKAAVAFTSGRKEPITLAESDLKPLLGPRRYTPVGVERTPEVGIATGLAWTAAGGEILFIESTRMEGRGQFVITGQLGSVMKESVQIAFSYVRSRAKELEIDLKAFDTYDLHIHFPEGAIPKDGPSAGITIATALTSLFTEKPVRHEVAMTGEISLRGRVLPVGGIKEKVLAAYRAGLTQVLLPAQNDKDLEELPSEVLSRMDIHLVRDMEEVLQWAILHVIMPRLSTHGAFEGIAPQAAGRGVSARQER